MKFTSDEWCAIAMMYRTIDNETMKEAMQNELVDFFLKKGNGNYSGSLFYHALRNCNSLFLENFYSLFKKDLLSNSKVYSEWNTQVRLTEILLDFCFPNEHKAYCSLYLNESNFMFEKNGKIPYFNDNMYPAFKSHQIERAFKYDLPYVQLYHFEEIAQDKNYYHYFLSFIENTEESYSMFLKGIKFYDRNLEAIISLKQNKNIDKALFKKFVNQQYAHFVKTQPEILLKASGNLDIVTHLLTMIPDKEKYLSLLYKNREKASLYKLKEKGLYNSKAPILYAAIKGNTDFINFMINYGYKLSDKEKLYIKNLELDKKIKNFEDNLYQRYTSQLKDKSENEKAYYLFNLLVTNNITQVDFDKLLDTIDLNKIINEYYPIIHGRLSYEQMIEKYIGNSASLIDVMLKKNNIMPLVDMQEPEFSSLQKNYLSHKIITHFKNFRFSKENEAFNYENKIANIQNKINPEIISMIYHSFLTEGQDKMHLKEDYILAQKINKDELFKNKEIFTVQSLPMIARFLKEGGEINKNEYLCALSLAKDILTSFDIQKLAGREDSQNIPRFAKIVCDINDYQKNFTEILKTYVENNMINLQEIFIEIDKELLSRKIKVPGKEITHPISKRI